MTPRVSQPIESDSSGERPIRLGVSSCLLGNEVRYDGGHKRDRFVTDVLGGFVEWVPVCPEVEAGMGTPRPPVQLVRDGDASGVRIVEVESGRDHTRAMQRYAARRVRELRGLDLCGYILKKDSPSCGMTRVKVYEEKGGPARQGTPRKQGMPRKQGRGLYASALIDAYPNLPCEDEGRLDDSKLRENFIERVFAYRRLGELFRGRWTREQVVAFHAAHKLQLLAHSASVHRELGRLVAAVKRMPRAVFRERYESGFMDALAHLASRGRNANVLQHAAGHLKTSLDAASRNELAELIHDYRKGLVPLVVPATLIGHHARRHDIDYLRGQIFLEPHPKELMLRNHV